MTRAYGVARESTSGQRGPAGASLGTVWLVARRCPIVVGMENRPHLVIIVGSVREGRFGSAVASWVAEQVGPHGAFEAEVVDLAEFDIPLALPAASPKLAGDDYPRPAGMAALTSALARADAFIVVTPEYNHSYPASLKAAIDWHFTQWTAKPVAFVSYGGAAYKRGTRSCTWRTC